MDIPLQLQQRPRFKGMPIPYTTFIGNDGCPDFKVLDVVAVRSCYQQRLCALCGQSLSKQIVFIGGPVSAENSCFVDPAMHLDCALYAVSVCPYLANPNSDYSSAPPKHRKENDVKTVHYHMSPGRPKKMAFYYCNGYDLVIQRHGENIVIIAKAWAATKIDWDIIPQLTG